MPEFSRTIISLFNHRREAPEQGGLLTGHDPTDPATLQTDPIRIWIIQVGIIVATASLLSLVLRKIRQPKVIAEVLGGILLGPTAFGQIPGFKYHIFNDQSKSYLSLVANIGLVLFLFLVGLEIDGSVIKRNARLSLTVALAGMVLPFGLGVALAVPLYNQFVDESIKFTYFMLFTGVAFSITAFPVLCRILTELKLLDTTVGIVVLSAGVGNDIVGWVLLALSVALVNAGSGTTAVYILLACVGWTLLLLFPVKFALRWLAVKTGSIEHGPTMFFMTVTILCVFGSAFFTDVIGVHAIFGAFVVGIIVPREGGLAISLTEKLEDMVSIIFLPLYFTLSGLSTDLTLLNNGITWGFTFAIISLAFIGKFGGCTIAARFGAGFSWREACTIGSLMSCKGLVELIVLNVGLSAGILSQRVFSMFVLEALVLTFMTTPLVTIFYPPDKRVRVAATGANFGSVPDKDIAQKPSRSSGDSSSLGMKRRFTVVLDRLENVPSMMALSQLIHPNSSVVSNPRSASPSGSVNNNRETTIQALRLIQLSDRVSAVMKSSAADTLLQSDPLLAVYRMFGQLNDLKINTALSIVTFDDFPTSVTEHARQNESDMILLPWLPPTNATVSVEAQEIPPTPKPISHNPFDALLKATAGSAESNASVLHSTFIRNVFSQASSDVALFVDLAGVVGVHGSSQHLFLPFFGGPDDRLALDFVAQMCESSKTTATVLRVTKKEVEAEALAPPSAALLAPSGMEEVNANMVTIASAFPDTVYGPPDTATRIQSETADNICWSRYETPNVDHPAPVSASAISRMEFRHLSSSVPLHAIINEANEQSASLRSKRLLVVTGRSRRLAVESHTGELKTLMDEHRTVGSDVKKTIGDVATAFVVACCGSGIITLQAAVGNDY